MAILRIMIGLPASGKSTYCSEWHNNGWIINSSDAIREEFYGSEDVQSHNDIIFNTMLRRTLAALAAGVDCIYDATNLVAKRRANLIKEIRRHYPDTHIEAIVMATPYFECLKRNLARERHVPAYVIQSMMKRFEMPAEWEGFDEIRVYGNEKPNNVNIANELIKIAERMNHDNHNHSLTVGHHMQKAYALYTTESIHNSNYSVGQAILFHDIGKIYCKSFTNFHGDPTDEAHFYNHENVSAYLYLSLLAISNINGILRPCDKLAINLIQHHMDYFKGEKYLDKVREHYGDDFMEKLAIVHKYDMASH